MGTRVAVVDAPFELLSVGVAVIVCVCSCVNVGDSDRIGVRVRVLESVVDGVGGGMDGEGVADCGCEVDLDCVGPEVDLVVVMDTLTDGDSDGVSDFGADTVIDDVTKSVAVSESLLIGRTLVSDIVV